MESTKTTNHGAIADAALPLMEAHPEGLLLSRLGFELRRELGDNFRVLLGSKRLGDVLRQYVGSRALFDGHGSEMKVRLLPKIETQRAPIIHFEPRFWAAFSKPIRPPSTQRWLQTEHPFQFEDLQSGESAPAGWMEVQASRIPSVALPTSERSSAIIESIGAWCAANRLDPEQFRQRARQRAQSTSPPSPGVLALRALVDAVPENERAKFSLPLDLISRLLRQE